MKSHRVARVAEVVREVAATTILFDLRDPRVKGVTVTRAEVAADLQHAKVFVSVMGTDQEQRAALNGLNKAAGFVQSKLADRLLTRFLPVITFVPDVGVKKSMEVARLLAEERRAGRLTDDPPTDAAVDGTADADTDEQGDDADDGDSDGGDGPHDSKATGGEDAPGPPPAPPAA